jgi:hypothetical protein
MFGFFVRENGEDKDDSVLLLDCTLTALLFPSNNQWSSMSA